MSAWRGARRTATAAAAAGAWLLGSAGPAAACALALEDGARVSRGGVQLAWRTEPAAIVNGQPFSMRVRVCPANASLQRVDATMPEHRHGMNYAPSLKPLGGGVWQVEGLLWHMAGRWELRWDVVLDGQTEALSSSVNLR
jgi:hypothetical protein